MFMKRWQGLVEEFKEYLPVNSDTPKLTLNEGHTPLIHCENLSKMLDIDLYVKYEGANPTGSFKDRGMVMAVTKKNKEKLLSVHLLVIHQLQQHAARAGLKAIVVIPEGKIALGKLSQAVMYGAEIVSIEGNFDEALEIVKEIAENDEEIELVNSVNPYRIEGQKRVHLKLLNNWNKLQTYSQFQLETQAILLLIGKVLKNTMRKKVVNYLDYLASKKVRHQLFKIK